ncbi:MAG: DUF6446 family protein [Paracoccaceae bacterium]
MTGRALVIGLLGFTAVFAAGLYYMQVYAFYEETVQTSVDIAGQSYQVSDWTGIDAGSSPLKLRACFRIEAAVDAPVAADPTPLVPPPWFDCFDAEMIARAIDAGEATAYLAAAEERHGADRMVAIFPDGRAFMWRQLTPEFADQ